MCIFILRMHNLHRKWYQFDITSLQSQKVYKSEIVSLKLKQRNERIGNFLFLALLITFSVELQSEGQAEIIEIYRYENAIEN